MRDLGALPGGVNSFAIWNNNAGEVAGLSENGRVDPLGKFLLFGKGHRGLGHRRWLSCQSPRTRRRSRWGR
jgi:hypothetical protein